MTKKVFQVSVLLIALAFTTIFCALVIPPFIKNPDLFGAFAAGFVNPFASGYSTDVVCCWVVLFIWVIYESPKIKHGWICLLLGLIPGVAVGFAGYLFIRSRQLKSS